MFSVGRFWRNMKSLVALAPHPQFAESIRAALEPLQCRVVHRLTVAEAEPLLAHGLASVCIVDMESTDVQGIWIIERILRRSPQCSIIVCSASRQSDWEEELYLLGVKHVLGKPLQSKLLLKVVKDLISRPPQAPLQLESSHPLPSPDSVPVESGGLSDDDEAKSLKVLRQFSEVLTHSLNAEALVRQFLNLLREVLGVNRAAIFLNQPTNASSENQQDPGENLMQAACAIGVVPSFMEHCTLSRDAGIGGYLVRTGRILRRQSPEASEALTQREFEMIGVEVAVPILDHDGLIGVAAFDRRITGKPLRNSEIEAIFHLLEQVGIAIANIRVHDRLVGSNQLLGDALKELSSACIVVGPDLSVLHANKVARRLLGTTGRRSGSLDFSELPESLGGKIYQVIKTGAALPSFRYETGHSVFSASIVPIRSSKGERTSGGNTALLVMEDQTQSEQLQKLEVEAANLRLVNNMADRLAAEIGNAIMPLSVHHQLLPERFKDDEFRSSLDSALGSSVKRVSRLASQMRFIYGNSDAKKENIMLGKLIDEADTEARKYCPDRKAHLECSKAVRETTVFGNSNALRHTFTEIILNGYQSSAKKSEVWVRLIEGHKGNGVAGVGIEFEDAGKGFSEEAARQAVAPFYTTQSVGVGLGLSSVDSIIGAHGGRLELLPAQKSGHGVVRVFLPAGRREE